MFTKECDTRLTAHGTWTTLSAEWGGLQDSSSWVSVPGNLQRTSQEASGFTEFSYNIQREKDGNFTIKLAIDNYLGSSQFRQSPCRLPMGQHTDFIGILMFLRLSNTQSSHGKLSLPSPFLSC